MAAVGALLPYGQGTLPAGIAPASVVDMGYCAPGQVALRVREKMYSFTGQDKFTVMDDRGTIWFRMDAQMFSMRDAKTLSDGAGRPVLTLRRKLWSIHGTCEILNASGQLVAAVKRTIWRLSPVLNIYVGPDASSRKGTGDYVVNTKFPMLDFEVAPNVDGKPVILAHIHRLSYFCGDNINFTMSEADRYSFSAQPGVDLALLVALCIILDEMREKRDN